MQPRDVFNLRPHCLPIPETSWQVDDNSVITAEPDTTPGLLCREHSGIATLVEPESLPALLAGIDPALQLPLPNVVAQNYARRFLDKENILRQFKSDLLAQANS